MESCTQLCFNFNEAEALLENIYVVEPVDEDVIPTVVKRKKKKGKRTEPVRLDDYTGKKMTFFHDPDNLPLEIHE